MSFDDSHQYLIAIPNANGESQTIIFTPEVLPEQLIPLVQKKHLKEEKSDYSNLSSVYKKILENLESGNSSNLSNLIDVSSIVNLGDKPKISNAESITDSINSKNINSTAPSIIRNLQANLNSGSSLPTTFLLQTSNLNQNSQNLGSSSDQTGHSENSSNYITTIQISQNNSNLSTLAFNQPQALLHYSKQNQDSQNTVLIPISIQNSNQYTQQQIIVAAGGYNQNCGESVNNTISSNSNHSESLNVTSLAKLISSNCSNPLSISLNNLPNKSNSSCSEVSPNTKLTHKSKPGLMNNEEFGKRKEIRLLKNREAARECRRKKKEYVKCLENRVANLEQQNKVLVDEINRMKDIYSKKSKPTLHILNPDMNNKFMDVYSSDNAMKEDIFDSATEENSQISSIDKSYSITISGNTQTSTTSDVNNFNISKSKLHPTHLDNSRVIINASNLSTNKDSQNLLLKLKKENTSALSLLLSGDHKPYNQQVFEPNSIIFPESLHESNPIDYNNSRNNCDSN